MFRRGHAFLKTIEWASIIGSALALAFCLLVLLPAWRFSESGNRPSNPPGNEEGVQPQLPEETFWQRTTEDPVALYTLVLAVFTALLALATIRLWDSTKGLHEETKRLAALADEQSRDMKASIAVAQKSADAAKLSAEASIGAETARIRPTQISLEPSPLWNIPAYGLEPTIKDMLTSGSAILKFKNSGRTEADITAISVNYRTGAALPPEPEYVEPLPHLSTITIAAHGGEWTTWDYRLKLSGEDVDAIADGKLTLWVYGYLEFFDFIGDLVRIGFCARMSPIGLLPKPIEMRDFRFAGPSSNWQTSRNKRDG